MIKIQTVKKCLLICAGSLSLILGVIGAFLPVLPTTPFLLLSAYCYIRSSMKLYLWLINHRFFGNYIYNYLTYRAVTRSTKIGTLFFLWLTLSVSIYITANLHLTVFLVAVGIGVTIHLLVLKTMPAGADSEYFLPRCPVRFADDENAD